MEHLPEHLIKKILHVSNEVKEEFRKKGVAIPTINDNGSISLGNYTVTKNSNGFYNVLDYSGEAVVSQLNLPQTAAIVANNLALGKFVDVELVDKDRRYGYALFEEDQSKRALAKSSKKDLSYFDLMLTKHMISKAKKELYKSDIVKSFEKLRNLV
jgi:hypothetical protein